MDAALRFKPKLPVKLIGPLLLAACCLAGLLLGLQTTSSAWTPPERAKNIGAGEPPYRAGYTLTLEAYPTRLTVGDSSTLTATVVDEYTNPVSGQEVVFETDLGSLDSGGTTVTKTTDANGRAYATLTSTTTGTVTVMAMAGSIADTATVTFNPGPPAVVTLEANPTSLKVGQTSYLTATVTDAYGNGIPGIEVLVTTTLGLLDGGQEVRKPTDEDGAITCILHSTEAGVAMIRFCFVELQICDEVAVIFRPAPVFLPIVAKGAAP